MWYKNSTSCDNTLDVNSVQSLSNAEHVVKKNCLRYCENLVCPRGTDKSLNMLYHSNTLNKQIIVCSVAELGTHYLSPPLANQCS